MNTRAVDVTQYIRRRGVFSAWVVQKLAYYCQAWSLAWNGDPLFDEEFEAWRDGPVCPEARSDGGGNPEALSESQRRTVEAVLAFYGSQPQEWLIELTHREDPWKVARGAAPLGAHGSNRITKDAIRNYYSAQGIAPHEFTSEYMTALEILVVDTEDDLVVDGSDFVEWLELGVSRNWEQSTN